MKLRTTLGWWLLLLLAHSGLAQDIAAKVDDYVNAFVKTGQFMGSVLVAKGGKVVVAKGYGMADVEWSVPNTPQTKFHLGSITKQFTATAVMQLQEKGKLSVNDPVTKYVTDAAAAWNDITIYNLLTHTSGIHDYTSLPDYGKRMREATTPTELLSRFKNLPLDFAPGSQFKYSNAGYSTLGYIIEKASGQSYENYLKQHVFDPLEMRNTGYDHPQTVLPMRASGYTNRGDHLENAEYLEMGIPFSAGSLYSTVEDLYRWDRALYTEKVLPKPALEKMFTPFKSNYGFGWTITSQSGRKIIAHNGGINGFATNISRYPDDDVCIVVLSNVASPASGRISQGLAAIVFGEPYRAPKEHTAIPIDPKLLDRYTGRYQLGPRVFTISQESGHLMAQLEGQPTAELFPEGEAKFFMKVVDAQVDFSGEAGAKATQLTLHQNGRDIKAPRIEN